MITNALPLQQMFNKLQQPTITSKKQNPSNTLFSIGCANVQQTKSGHFVNSDSEGHRFESCRAYELPVVFTAGSLLFPDALLKLCLIQLVIEAFPLHQFPVGSLFGHVPVTKYENQISVLDCR